jgi:T5orf172 domain
MSVGYVYFIRPIGMLGPIKIGHSKMCATRLMALSAYSPFPLEIAAKISGGEALEARFHTKFRHLHSHAEWFVPGDDLLEAIKQIQAGDFPISSLPLGAVLNKYAGRWDDWERERASLIGLGAPAWVTAAVEVLMTDNEERRRESIDQIETYISDPLSHGIPVETPRARAKLAAYRAGTYRYRTAA